MGKLFSHVVVAGGLIWAGNVLAWSWWLTTIAVVAGAFAVHLVWERFLVSPFVHLGAMEIDNDDPLILSAYEQARATWPEFVAIYPEHREDSMVKFRLTTRSGDVENVWGDLLDVAGETAEVYLRTPPVGEVEIQDRRMSIPSSDIVDWQVEFRDGTLRGGFSQRALFRIYEREEGHMPREFQDQLGRYRDLAAPTA